MASSNRHWPSMFRSKPSNPQHQWQHDINSSLMSSGCHRSSPYSSGCEERTPEPKPRWNPKPEQIRILEAIFNSGMVNPPRDEIRKIRAQLQEYGQVGDANVFYWFQNRKSRSKHKLRNLQNSKQNPQMQNPQQTNQVITTTNNISCGPSSSSSSSEKSSPKGSNKNFPMTSSVIMEPSNSPTGSVNQTYFQTQGEFLQEPFFFPIQQQDTGGITAGFTTQGFCFSDLSNLVHQMPEQTVGPCTSLLLSEIMNHNGASAKKDQEGKMVMKDMLQQQQLTCCNNTVNITSFSTTTHPTVLPPPSTTTLTVSSTINQIQGIGDLSDHMCPTARSVVYINDVALEVGPGPFNVREAFGDDALLLHISGQPVLTNEFGVTLQPLQHGASYHLISLKHCDWGSSRENVNNLLV